MTTRIIACVVVAVSASFAPADDAEIKKTAKAKAEETQNALLKGDYDKLVDLTHPKIVEEMGGRKKMIEGITASVKDMKSKGFTFKSVSVGDSSDSVKTGKELYIIVPFALQMAAPSGRLHTKGALVGVSSDGGKTWAFADATPGREALKKLLPGLPEAIVFPKKEAPTFVKD
ncbi:hypothetical protein J8F10_20000 [Gemmata sp. G18]|uniref:Uncharacterized protein n=1 Tax=Gemmata palustris TaxID=2822762 RepID=A0ABS5BVT2_9BACT|nr:NTF2-like N-terminal transpeptidase domain-containing protein [Gemmata palustris]MBP3957537.1 hypothetical protein [Gemmata palustris]